MTLFDKRLAAAETRVGTGDRPLRLCFVQADGVDPEAEIARHHVEAERDHHEAIVVRFVSPDPLMRAASALASGPH